MAVILKPGGVAVVAIAVLGIGGMAVGKIAGANRGRSAAPGVAPVVAPGAAQAAALKTGEVAGKMTALSAAASGNGKIAVGTQEKQLLPVTALSAEGWTHVAPPVSADMHVYKGAGVGGYSDLLRVTVLKSLSQPWDVQLRQTLSGSIAARSHLRLRVWARSKDSCPITLVCEHNDKPYEKLATREFALTPEWQECEMDWTADRNAPKGWGQVSIQLGAKAGQIDLAGASLVVSSSTP